MNAKNQRKVLILLPSLKFGGGERVSLNLASEMKRRGISVEILVMKKEGEFLLEAEKEFSIIDLKCFKTFVLPFKLIHYIYKNNPDVLISNFWKLNLCSSILKILFPSLTLILWEHSPPSRTPFSPTWLYALTASFFYRFANNIVAVSGGVQKDIVRITIGLSKKIIVIYNPITPPKIILDHRVINEPNHTPQIISIGRLEEEKNVKLLINAFAIVLASIDAKLCIVGDGSLRDPLMALCLEKNIAQHVRFVGFTDTPYRYIMQSDLLVMSSNFEGLPTVIVEALYCGISVVSTDCPTGPREILNDGEYGTLVPLNDEQAMANAILFELKNKRFSTVQKAAANRFLPVNAVDQFLKLM